MKWGGWRLLLSFCLPLCAWGAPGVVVELDAPLNDATARYVVRALDEAERTGASAVVLVVKKGAGLWAPTQRVVGRLLDFSIPVVTVASGEPLWGPGLLVLLAGDVALVAPSVELGRRADSDDPPAWPAGPDLGGESFRTQLANLADSVARARGRSAPLAAQLLRGRTLQSGREGIDGGLWDGEFASLEGLAAQLPTITPRINRLSWPPSVEGWTQRHPDPVTRVLQWLSHPWISYGLVIVGALGGWAYLATLRWFWLGVGAGLGTLGLWTLAWIPVSYGNLGATLLGLSLITLEAFFPLYGALLALGTGVFLWGSLHLVDTQAPGFALSPGLVLPVAALLPVVAWWLFRTHHRHRERRASQARQDLVGQFGQTREAITAEGGTVFIHGAVHRALPATEEPIAAEALVKVLRLVDGVLVVQRV